MFCTAAVADCATLCWLWWQVTWYTTMVGKKSTLGVALTALQALGVTCIRTNHFFQGHTIRWGVAWSYHPSAAFSPYYRRVVPELVEKSFTVSGKERRTGDSLAATPNAPPLYRPCAVILRCQCWFVIVLSLRCPCWFVIVLSLRCQCWCIIVLTLRCQCWCIVVARPGCRYRGGAHRRVAS